MFIRRSHLNSILRRLNTLERQNETHSRFLHNDYDKLDRDNQRLEILENRIGIEKPTAFDEFIRRFGFYSAEEPKLTLTATVHQLVEYLGLTIESSSSRARLVKKTVKPVKKINKKGEK
jgi:hypothetical protein